MAVMPTISDYTTTESIKDRLRLYGSSIDTNAQQENAILSSMIAAASRAIDKWTLRNFYPQTLTLYFAASYDESERSNLFNQRPSATHLDLGEDLLSVTSLKTDEDGDGVYEITWAATDYILEPWNAAAKIRPYEYISTNPMQGRYRFPYLPKSIEIVGSWGYANSPPEPIKEACERLVERMYRMRDVNMAQLAIIEGVNAQSALNMLKKSPDVVDYIMSYKKVWAFA